MFTINNNNKTSFYPAQANNYIKKVVACVNELVTSINKLIKFVELKRGYFMPFVSNSLILKTNKCVVFFSHNSKTAKCRNI